MSELSAQVRETPNVEDTERAEEDTAVPDLGWMSTQAAARYLGITNRTLYRFIDEGQLPAYKMGRVFRLKRSDVDAFIENSRIQPGTLANLYPPRKGELDD